MITGEFPTYTIEAEEELSPAVEALSESELQAHNPKAKTEKVTKTKV